MNKRIIVFSNQPYDELLSLMPIEEIKNSFGFFTGIIFVLVDKKLRKNMECAVELSGIDIPIVDFGDYDPEPTDKLYVLGERFTTSALKKLSNVFSPVKETVGQFGLGGLVPAF